MRKFLFTAVVAVFAIYTACTPKAGTSTAATPPPPVLEPAQWDTIGKPAIGEAEGEEPMEYHTMDTIDVSSGPIVSADSLAPYNPSHTFEVDLLHTKIEISFDWAKKHANAKAILSMRPWFYPTDRVTLDAKGFDIHSVTMDGKTEALKYEYENNEQLTIFLPKTYNRTEEFRVAISYTAKPDERKDIGGSAAITSDKGLYFINADGAEADKPKQIWTQGETESNSCWFPTIDKPNERCTQEMYITVEDRYKTLSNGLLASSKKNADGTRTDYWKMDKPHAPYLFMMAIGEYAVVKDKWRGIDVDYYVEPKYEADARAIFPYTTEMLDFFSNKLNYPYVWPKFSQVVVRDYVSGAMENTTAVIFGEFMNGTRRELLDQHLTNEKIVAHEMFHQWFGDLVTTESWANLTMNEGFANYAEYLWLEQKYGRDEADAHEKQEQEGYIFSAAGGGERLIRFGYKNREDMFDAHSYNKGGAVLHMLRSYVGDEAFWAALNRYLRKNEYTDVEAHELRLAFEDVTGQDLNWFFNQWYFGAGHPNLEISYAWDETTKKASVNIAQTQEATAGVAYVFDLPMYVDIYDASGKARRERIRVSKRNQTFTFDAPEKPAAINVDAEKTLLCVKDDRHTPEEWAFLYRKAPLFRDRIEALEALESQKESAVAAAIFAEALNDKYWGIRQKVLDLADLSTPEALTAVAKMAEFDATPETRGPALRILGESGDAKYLPIVKKSIDASQSYSVVGAALGALVKLDPKSASEAAKALENETNDAIVAPLAELFAQNPNRANLPFFEQRMGKVDQLGTFAFFDQYQKYLTGLGDDAVLDQGIDLLKKIAFNGETSQWRRFGSTKALADIRNFFREKGSQSRVDVLQKLIEEIKEKETDETLKLYYSMF